MNAPAPRPQPRLFRAYRLVNRPYYWFRPGQLLARLWPDGASDAPGGAAAPRLVRTAWGSRLYCWPDSLGLAVARTGVYDLPVAETLARLTDPGETAVDAGANVGLMTNLLAHAVGRRGRVVSFEPHPLVFETLARNAAYLSETDRLDVVELRQAGVSQARGTLPLRIDPDTFSYNKGTASLRAPAPSAAHAGADPNAAANADADANADANADADADADAESIEVATVRLDEELVEPVGVLKLDVEMHELEALSGASGLLSRGAVRDIVFEEHEPPPTPVTQLLESYGYTILGIRQGVLRPLVSAPLEAYRRQLWDPPALLATRDPARARERLRPLGWRSLRRDLARRRD
jgi:FkbM family methyltransferase